MATGMGSAPRKPNTRDIDPYNPTILDESSLDYDKVTRQDRELQQYQRSLAALTADDSNIKTASDIGTSVGSADVSQASSVDFYSPWLSTDYYELPRSYSEERRWYRFFYDQDPLVGRAIDLKTYIPLAKMTLGAPKTEHHRKAQVLLSFYDRMWRNLKMFEKLIWIMHEYHVIGEVIVYFEWDEEKKVWSKVLILDPDLCEVKYLPFQDETQIFMSVGGGVDSLLSDAKDLLEDQGLVSTLDGMWGDTSDNDGSEFIQLNTDPRKGSFAKYFSRKRSPYRAGPGVSILRRILRPLLFRDKIRQALTQITSRHMTPVRLVWADGLGPDQVEELRTQVDYALTGPDYSIVTSYQVNWEEITAEGRLFDTTAIHDQTTKEILIGLGMPEEILTGAGEGGYGSGRITLQILDTEYALERSLLAEMVEELFRVVAEKNDFKEVDEETGIETLLFANLNFSRMALRDYSDMFDFFSNMVANGQLDKGTLLEMFNIDPIDVENKQKENFLGISDNLSDEFRRNVLGELTSKVVAETDVFDRLIEGWGLKRMEPEAGADGMDGGMSDFDSMGGDDMGLADMGGEPESPDELIEQEVPQES